MTPKAHLFEYGATELEHLVRSRQVSCREVVEAHLKRIDVTNGDLGAVTFPRAESALAEADARDRGSRDETPHDIERKRKPGS